MLNLKAIPADALTALKFSSEQEFRKAARLAVEKKIPVDAPGYETLIVRKEDTQLFAQHGLKFLAEGVADPQTVSSKELSGLRRFYTKI